MCDFKKCRFCTEVRLGLLMSWIDCDNVPQLGHVCYPCEDRLCNEMALGRSKVRWLQTLEGCQ